MKVKFRVSLIVTLRQQRRKFASREPLMLNTFHRADYETLGNGVCCIVYTFLARKHKIEHGKYWWAYLKDDDDLCGRILAVMVGLFSTPAASFNTRHRMVGCCGRRARVECFRLLLFFFFPFVPAVSSACQRALCRVNVSVCDVQFQFGACVCVLSEEVPKLTMSCVGAKKDWNVCRTKARRTGCHPLWHEIEKEERGEQEGKELDRVILQVYPMTH